MSIKKRLELTWKGKAVKVDVTMELINRIEDTVNLSAMLLRVNAADVRLSHAATLLSMLLTAGGTRVTPENVYETIFDADEFDMKALAPMLSLILSVVFPTAKKKTATSSTSPKSKAKKRKSKAKT